MNTFRQHFFKIILYTVVMEKQSMKQIERFMGGAVAALAIVVAAGNSAFAQGPQDGPPPPGRGPQGGGRPPRRNPPPISAATLPLDVMTNYLNLTDTQTEKIKEINQALREEMRPPRPAEGAEGMPPAPPSRAELEARSKTMDAAIQKASDSVTALLDGGQKAKLGTLLNAFQAFRAGRIPPPAVTAIKLTGEQWEKIGALGKTATPESIRGVLTDAQKSILESFRTAPGDRPGPGGRPGPGRFGDGPPPHDGPGGEGPPPPP